MTFPERVRFQKALQAYKMINNICPKYWYNYFTFTNEICSKNLLSGDKFSLYIPNPNVERFHKTFAYSGADIWNSLPHDVKNAPSIKTFKSRNRFTIQPCFHYLLTTLSRQYLYHHHLVLEDQNFTYIT